MFTMESPWCTILDSRREPQLRAHPLTGLTRDGFEVGTPAFRVARMSVSHGVMLACGVASLLLFTTPSGANAQQTRVSNPDNPGISYASQLNTPRYSAGVTLGPDGK